MSNITSRCPWGNGCWNLAFERHADAPRKQVISAHEPLHLAWWTCSGSWWIIVLTEKKTQLKTIPSSLPRTVKRSC